MNHQDRKAEVIAAVLGALLIASVASAAGSKRFAARRRGDEAGYGRRAGAARSRRSTSTRPAATARRRCTGSCAWTTSRRRALLIRAGADAKLANRYGVTPLSLACANGNAGDDPAAARCRRRSECAPIRRAKRALMMAARVGNLDAVKVLLDRGAVLDARDPDVPADGADGGGPRKPSRGRPHFSSSAAPTSTPGRGPARRPRGCCRTRCRASATASASSAAGCPSAARGTRFPARLSPLLYAARDGRLEIGADARRRRRGRRTRPTPTASRRC